MTFNVRTRSTIDLIAALAHPLGGSVTRPTILGSRISDAVSTKPVSGWLQGYKGPEVCSGVKSDPPVGFEVRFNSPPKRPSSLLHIHAELTPSYDV